MSSWLSQASEVLLNQDPYIPDAPRSQESSVPKISYSITVAPQEAQKSLPKFFTQKFQSQCKSEPPITHHKTFIIATPRERILRFGSSFESQLHNTSQAQTSSPWNLFSQKNSTEASKALMQELTMPKSPEKTSEKALDKNLSSKQEGSCKNFDTLHLQQHLKLFGTVDSLYSQSLDSEQQELLQSRREERSETYANQQSSEKKIETKVQIKDLCKDLFSQDQDSNQKQKKSPFQQDTSRKNRIAKAAQAVPVIPPPSIGVFTLSYLLTKQGILSDFSSYGCHKDSVESTQRELDALHEKRIETIKVSIEKEKRERLWGSLSDIIGWLAPFVSIGIGIVAILSGGGIFAFAGFFAGLISLVIKCLEKLKFWDWLEKHLPIKNEELRRKIITIIQWVVYLTPVILSICTLKVENLGFSPIIEGAIKGIQPAIESTMAALRCAILFSQAEIYKLKGKLTKIQLDIELKSFDRDDHYERSQELLDNMESSFEALSRILNYMRELDQVYLHSLRG
ncbi:hypothetical protein CpB1058 [Chlamydia pneumoniae TW-183]|uniref:Type III secretion translocator n=2 Tax=Chlamydia pneumoniae TaxID=83558 RepID=Q9Z6N9_CHLPN|nr:type III secretion system translocon subunit CopB2 [Chlamydia pneumoniae]AAD19157.1 CT861 hypothetical protein [Chlamydia pneumoniae CWL029]AAF38626.1 conserved hypothetical protein [Chlamydia pneumoniae AR39]AAP98988.1 hypothetical protein CpB1058 [Chlamydia pneumoniae TW-183]CRI33563.1 Uncharacterized protein BN1224_Wien1_A_10700 [Chlamydia pneumoniae]CRI36428.1 Uncharacterized protein BN1224_CM1_A_10750 [Chlamydia pneumoniae]